MGILGRFRRQRDDQREPRALSSLLSEQQLDELRETAREWIRSGFHGRADLPAELAEYRDDFDVEPAVVLRAATSIVEEEWAARLAEQRTWVGDSDYAKVSRAFDALAGRGIVARMNFACCQTCGTAEIDDERTPVDDPGEGYPFREWGYTFFHQQDAERLGDGPCDLYLSYSVFAPAPDLGGLDLARLREGGDAAQDVIRRSEVAVATAVADALRAEGLEVAWDGSTASRILVSIPDWRKPLPED